MIGGCAAAPPRSIIMPHVRAHLSADAPLTADLWAGATFTEPFGRPLADDRAAPLPPGDWSTRAKFTWDAEHLYVMIESIGPRPTSPFTQHDELLHEADVAEVFLDPVGDRRHIFEFQVSPSNVTCDYHHTWDEPATYPADRIDFPFSKAHHRFDRDWNLQDWRTTSTVTDRPDGDTTWTVMMAIPLRPLLAMAGRDAPLAAGQSVYVNALRYARPLRDDGKRVLEQYNLVPVRTGCPHHSPMAVVRLIAAKAE